MYTGLGEKIIQDTIALLADNKLPICIYKRTTDLLALQFNEEDYANYQTIRDFLMSYELDKDNTYERTKERINLSIAGKRLVTITLDSGGITSFVYGDDGLMYLPTGAELLFPPTIVKPAADYLDSFKDACIEFHKIGMVSETPNPEEYEEWKSTILQDLRESFGVETATYWLIHNDSYVGMVRYRKKLTKELLETSGDMFYLHIRPSLWNRGYGKLLIDMSIPLLYEDEGVSLFTVSVPETHKAPIGIVSYMKGKLISQAEGYNRYVVLVPELLGRKADFSNFVG